MDEDKLKKKQSLVTKRLNDLKKSKEQIERNRSIYINDSEDEGWGERD